MSTWMKNAIGGAVILVLLAIGWRVLQGDGGEAKIFEFGVKVNPRPAVVLSSNDPSSLPSTASAAEVQKGETKPQECRVSQNGIEFYGKTEQWTADSGWRKGGSSPAEFCAAQKSARESRYPDRTVVLLGSDEMHKSEYTPFKHDFYRYTCLFEDRWEPVFRLAANPQCSAE